MSELISVKLVKQDSRLQPRAKMDVAIIDEYTEAMRAGATFPAILVFEVDMEYYLVDGYHRYLAVQGAGFDKILADIRSGTMREAILYSAGVNATHGIRRTNDDKRRAVLILLRDKEWSTWNNQQIAKAVNVSDEFVRKIRAEIQTGKNTSPAVSTNVGKIPSKKILVERSGKTYKMDASNIGKKTQEPSEPEKEPQTDHIADASKTIPAPIPNSSEIPNSSPVTQPPAIPGCKGPVGCPYLKGTRQESQRGLVCVDQNMSVSQIKRCLRQEREEKTQAVAVDTGFRNGNGKPDIIKPKTSDAPTRMPTNEQEICEAFLKVVLDDGPEADFVRQLADTEFNGDTAQAEREIHIRVSVGGA